MDISTLNSILNNNNQNNNQLVNKSSDQLLTISMSFMPNKNDLCSKLLELKESLLNAKSHKTSKIKILANSGLILLLIPLILPLKERLKIEFNFEVISTGSLFTNNYESSKNFKDILEATLVLQNLGFSVGFNKTLAATQIF